MSKNKEKLLIVDGNALIHRSYHALPATMTTKNGDIVNAVFGFASVLIKTIKDFKPEYVVLTFDKKGPTFRHEKYKEYKAQRKKAPDELYMQIPMVKELVKAFNIPIFEMSGFEADDLIGTIAKKEEAEGIQSIVVTGDMDLLQLIDGETKVYKLGRGISDGTLFNKEQTIAKYGITPEQVIDYKALRGDASDNIPGVPGVGDKTALKLLDEYKTLDKIYKKIESLKSDDEIKDIVKPRIVSLLKDNKENAFLSYDLATIKCDVPIDFNIEDTRFGNFDHEKVMNILSELEFRSLISRVRELRGDEAESKEEQAENKFERNKKEFNYVLVDDDKKFNEFFEQLKEQKEFTFDTETTSLDPLTCSLLGISFSWKKGEAYYVVISDKSRDSHFAGAPQNDSGVDLFNYQDEKSKTGKLRIENNDFLKKLKPIFENSVIKKIAHNMKFDYRVMLNVGIKTENVYFDTMVASYLFNHGSRQHGLDALTFNELGFEKISKDDLLGTGKDKKTFGEVDIEKLYIYSSEDADFTHRLYLKLKKKIKKEKFDDLFNKIEMPLVEVLSEMEHIGIEINKKFLSAMSEKLNINIKKLEKRIHEIAGVKFNVRSTKQLKEILFEKLQISTKGIKKTKTGISTAFDELEKLKGEHVIIVLIQEHRELAKLTSTYIDALPELVNKKTSRIHTSYNQTVTATGRLSSTDPNLQNIPVKTDLGREIRKAFVAKKGYKLLAIDYSQIELRVTAHLSEDKELIKAFKAGVDVHTQTAVLINKIKTEEVTSDMRREAKAVNFGILYGQGVHGLSKAVDISYAEAKNFIEEYFVAFPGIKEYIEHTIENTKKTGFVETMFNRKRFLPDINSSTPMIAKSAERMAINTPVQGTAADILKIAMIEIYSNIKSSSGIKMLLQVHDELVFEVKEKEVQKYAKEIKKIMENVVKLKVPIVADVKIGDNWGEMDELKI